MRDGVLRLGCAGGYLQGRLEPGLRLASEGGCDALGLEALNEASLSVLQRELEADPRAGYHAAGIERVAAVTEAAGPETILASSIGGANPEAGAEELARRLRSRGLHREVACVSGDNLTARVHDLVGRGVLQHVDGTPVAPDELDGVFAASAYLGAEPIARALDEGARVVLTGRVVDSALYLGPAMHALDWDAGALDLLAAGSVAGHLLECAGHLLGGNYWGPRWDEVDYTTIGHGIADLGPDGRLEVTKLASASGLITRHTVAQQLLYEIGDPTAYVLPDVTVDVSDAALVEVGPERVRVEGVVGHPAPATLKVLLSRRAGYLAQGMATFTWPDAELKARRAADALVRRLEEVHDVDDHRVDLLGAGGLVPLPEGASAGEATEVTLRAVVAAPTPEQAGVVHDELANFYDCAPAGACGIVGPTAGSSSGVRERIEIVPCRVPRDEVPAHVTTL